jgi:hypothetical protein
MTAQEQSISRPMTAICRQPLSAEDSTHRYRYAKRRQQQKTPLYSENRSLGLKNLFWRLRSRGTVA